MAITATTEGWSEMNSYVNQQTKYKTTTPGAHIPSGSACVGSFEAACPPQAPHLEAILSRLGGCFESADEAAKRAGAVADRVVGNQNPSNVGGASGPVPCGGEIAKIYEMLDGLSLRISDVLAEILRLERL